jgi:hypothetical protein
MAKTDRHPTLEELLEAVFSVWSVPRLYNEGQLPPSQSVQASNANSLSLNDMFKVVATIFQPIMTELSGAESEEDRIMAITKIVLKLIEQNGR